MKNAGGSTITASAIRNPYLYTGRQLDEETGLYYYRARYYSAELRRFVQRDPLEYVDGPNAATYVAALPTLLVDPLGLETKKERLARKRREEIEEQMRRIGKAILKLDPVVIRPGLWGGVSVSTMHEECARSDRRWRMCVGGCN
jgi:RHS repeat-associated protein